MNKRDAKIMALRAAGELLVRDGDANLAMGMLGKDASEEDIEAFVQACRDLARSLFRRAFRLRRPDVPPDEIPSAREWPLRGD